MIKKDYPSCDSSVPPIYIVLCDFCGDEAFPPGKTPNEAAEVAHREGWLVSRALACLGKLDCPAYCPACRKEDFPINGLPVEEDNGSC